VTVKDRKVCTQDAASDFLGEDGIARVRDALAPLKFHDSRLAELRCWTTGPNDPEQRFREIRSRLNRKIERALGGEAWPALYTIAGLRLPGEDRGRYGIRLDGRLLGRLTPMLPAILSTLLHGTSSGKLWRRGECEPGEREGKCRLMAPRFRRQIPGTALPASIEVTVSRNSRAAGG
jgi:hypothetical protein